MYTLLGTLDADTEYEVTYVQDRHGNIYERRPNTAERFFCTQKLWHSTLVCAALNAQNQHIDILTYKLQQSQSNFRQELREDSS